MRVLSRLLLGAAMAMSLAAPAIAETAVFPHAAAVKPERVAISDVPLAGAKPFDLSQLRGKWVWLYMGYTHCPDACPFAMDWLASEYRHLADPSRVAVVFVSLDPDRDTPQGTQTYAQYFQPGFYGVTGARSAIDALVGELGTRYQILPPKRPNGIYDVVHPDLVWVLDPQGRLTALYTPSLAHPPGWMAADFAPADLQLAESPDAPIPERDTTAAVLAAPQSQGVPAVGWCGLGGQHAADVDMDPLMMRAIAMGSGTSVLPAASPMRMWAFRTNDWVLMAHGVGDLGFNHQSGPRGANTWAGENWEMLKASRYLGPGILDLSLMTSLEPLTLPPGGTPQLFQTGETYHFNPLIDKQHPHDLFDEVAARYTWNLNAQTDLFLYGGPAGEPALGPTSFMHRPSAEDNHWAPLAHHMQDSTHVSFGVATLGARYHDWQLEASAFNGREPDEFRYDFDLGPLDSYSARLSWFPGRNWSSQISWGHLTAPEVYHPGDENRTTASVTNVTETRLGRLSTSLVWGQGVELLDQAPFLGPPLTTESYLVESELESGANHFYARYELADKDGLPPDPPLNHVIHHITALTLGAVHDLGLWNTLDLGIGADATVYSVDAVLQNVYGDNPFSCRVYLSLQPPLMQH
ncbi:MAG TPA: SCO family protein [Oscillatoriaceae cyanobacterium]